MEKGTTDIVPVLVAILSVVLVIIRQASPYIIKIIKAAASLLENKSKESEVSGKSDQKIRDLTYTSQEFLSDVGKNYYQQLNRQFEEQKIRVNDLEQKNSDLKEKLQTAVLDKEELRIKYGNLLDDYNELKVKSSESVKELTDSETKSDKLQQRIHDMEIMIERLQIQLNNRIEENNRLTTEINEKKIEINSLKSRTTNLQSRLDENYQKAMAFRDNPVTEEISKFIDSLKPVSSAHNPVLKMSDIAAYLDQTRQTDISADRPNSTDLSSSNSAMTSERTVPVTINPVDKINNTEQGMADLTQLSENKDSKNNPGTDVDKNNDKNNEGMNI